MRLAIDEANKALPDVPIGAVVIDEHGTIIARGRNRREADGDPTAHAEILALRQAGMVRGRWHLGGCTLVVTLEPCTMCAGALVLARVDRVVFGAWDPKTGAAGSVRNITSDGLLNHTVEVTGGVLGTECGQMLRDFFAEKRFRAQGGTTT
ncbi:MAG TPA: nucleoside deaminase [Beutenbergiaceae bacterium]|nr:nucleoside deaminase [Beutenbergiaceae bacterium]